MALTIIVLILSIIMFSLTFKRIIKRKKISYAYIMGVELIGILISFFALIFARKINAVFEAIPILLSIIFPIIVFILEKKNYFIDEMIYCFIQRKVYGKSEKETLLSLIEKEPNSYYAHKRLAEIYEMNNELEKAENEYSKVIEIKPDDYKSYCKIANIFNKDNKTNLAVMTLQTLLKTDPAYIDASMLLGTILYESDKFKEAILVYNEALKYNPQEYMLYYSLGMTYVRLNDFQSAKECYKKAATINSIKDISNLSLGEISLIFKEYDTAEKYFFETINSDDEKVSANSYYYLAKIKLIKNDESMAIQYANLAIEIYPKLASKIEKDEIFIRILSKLKLKKNVQKKIKSELKECDEKTLEYLSSTYNVVERLTYGIENKDSGDRDIEK